MMPLFELFLNSECYVLPKPFNITATIVDVGNKKFETHEDEYGKRVLVNCDIKPRNSAIFGIRWEEVEQ
jgi:hypothetical protein